MSTAPRGSALRGGVCANPQAVGTAYRGSAHGAGLALRQEDGLAASACCRRAGCAGILSAISRICGNIFRFRCACECRRLSLRSVVPVADVRQPSVGLQLFVEVVLMS